MRRCNSWPWMLMGLLAACHGAEHEAEPAPVKVKVVRAVRGPMVEALTAVGPLAPPPGLDVKLGSLVAGRLAAVLVAEGDRVTKNQVLARLESTPVRDAVLQAEAQLAQARAQHANDDRKKQRAEKLFTAGIAARQEVDDAEAQAVGSGAGVRASEAALSTAKNQLSRTELRAPFDGLVAHVFAAAGEPLDGSGKPVIEVARTEVLEVKAVAPVQGAQRVKAGLPARIRVGTLERTWEGEVVAVSPLLDASTGTLTIRVRLRNPDGALKGGEMAQVQITLATRPSALLIPVSALVPDAPAEGTGASANNARVETVDAQNKAVGKKVTFGARSGDLVEVTDGLAENERVVVQGAYALPEGTPLIVEDAQP